MFLSFARFHRISVCVVVRASGCSNTGKGSGGFKGFHEEAPELHAISALLSTGPVSPSDGVDGADVGLLMTLCRADGLLLKPDKPARAIDAKWLGVVFNSSAPTGTLWSTSTTLENFTWGYVLSVYEATDWAASAESLNLPGGTAATKGVSWIRPPHGSSGSAPAPTLSEFSGTSPLHIPAQPGETYGKFNLLLTAPTLPNGMTLLVSEAGGEWHKPLRIKLSFDGRSAVVIAGRDIEGGRCVQDADCFDHRRDGQSQPEPTWERGRAG